MKKKKDKKSYNKWLSFSGHQLVMVFICTKFCIFNDYKVTEWICLTFIQNNYKGA